MQSRSLALAAVFFVAAATATLGQGLTEVGGPWQVAAPSFYEPVGYSSPDSSGTYYFPAMIQQGTTAFMFTQGGQFAGPGSTAGSPVSNWCEGDKIVLWTNPLTDAGLTSRFTQKRIISRCDSNSTTRYHWGPAGAFLTGSTGPVYLIANRTGIDKATGQSTGLQSYYLYSGSFNANSDDMPTWTVSKLFDVSSTVGGVGCCTMAFDTTRTAPNDGYTHQLFRGFGGASTGVIEVRMDFSSGYCVNGTSSSPEACVIIEMKSGGAWRKVNSGLLDFTPDGLTSVASGFRPNNLFKRGANLELWGTQVGPALTTPCPCTPPGNQNSADVRWYTVNQTDFSLTGPSVVSAAGTAVRCMPASPAANRLGADLLVVSGHTYLFSSQNDDAQSGGVCTSTPFIGMDVVSTQLQ